MRSIEPLLTALSNEKATRRLLPHVPYADELLAVLRTAQPPENEPQVIRSLRELEVERIRYLIREYVMLRLEKMTRDLFTDQDLLSPRERVFFARYANLLQKQGTGYENKGNGVEYAGFYCVRGLESIRLDGEVMGFKEGDFFSADFDDVKEYLREGSVVLV